MEMGAAPRDLIKRSDLGASAVTTWNSDYSHFTSPLQKQLANWSGPSTHHNRTCTVPGTRKLNHNPHHRCECSILRNTWFVVSRGPFPKSYRVYIRKRNNGTTGYRKFNITWFNLRSSQEKGIHVLILESNVWNSTPDSYEYCVTPFCRSGAPSGVIGQRTCKQKAARITCASEQ